MTLDKTTLTMVLRESHTSYALSESEEEERANGFAKKGSYKGEDYAIDTFYNSASDEWIGVVISGEGNNVKARLLTGVSVPKNKTKLYDPDVIDATFGPQCTATAQDVPFLKADIQTLDSIIQMNHQTGNKNNKSYKFEDLNDAIDRGQSLAYFNIRNAKTNLAAKHLHTVSIISEAKIKKDLNKDGDMEDFEIHIENDLFKV